MNLLLLNFNNYYNRKIKKYSTVADYEANSTKFSFQYNVNFIPNDGVNTEQIINFNEEWKPDYVVCVDEYNNINSRWFIIKSTRTRNGQFKLELKRDTIVDYYDKFKDAPCYIDRAMPRTINDFSIWNGEGMTFNQIKQSETILKDTSGLGWIVGYCAVNTPAKTISIPSTALNTIRVSSLEAWDFNKYRTSPYRVITSKELNYLVTFWVDDYHYPVQAYKLEVGGNYAAVELEKYVGNVQGCEFRPGSGTGVIRQDYPAALRDYINTRYDNIWSTYLQNDTTNDLHDTDNVSSLDGKYIYDISTGKYYAITVNKTGTGSITSAIAKGSTLESAVNGMLGGFSYLESYFEYDNTTTDNKANLTRNIAYETYTILLTESNLFASTYNFSATANILSDAPYKMFAIPYGNIMVVNAAGKTYQTVSALEALNIATATAASLGASLYDLQLLPYCPIRDITGAGVYGLNLANKTENTDFNIVYNTAATPLPIGIVLYAKYSNFAFDLPVSISVPTNVKQFKVMQETTFYRLCSPNYAAQFEFNACKCMGFNKIVVNCTYKPYNPYIRLCPNFKGLYGKEYGDYRGLVCQGDFSIPVINDQWQNYQINNKNYLNAFNRETNNLETKWGYQNVTNWISGVLGSTQGASYGALAGFSLGGGTGAVIGGIAGGSASLGGGIADAIIANKIHQEDMSNRRDQWNMQLENIKAMPTTIAKGSAYDYNNKIFPVLEFYSAGEQSKVLDKYIDYKSMSINRIATISDYVQSNETFISGKLVLSEEIDCDYYLLSDINEELKIGIRIKE